MTEIPHPHTAAEAIAMVDATPIPAHPGAPMAETDEIPPPDFDRPGALSVTVGSQIAGFAAEVPAPLRQSVSDAFLLAQLAADKAIESGGGTEAWYDAYTATLGKVGWTLEASDRSQRDVSGANVEVHREILTVIATILGPGVAVAGSVLAVLNGLANMDRNAPWITLFQKRSQRADANQFQISHTGIDGGRPVIRLVGFALDARRSVTQVLFFKFGSSDATLRQYVETLSVNESVFTEVAPHIARKLGAHVAEQVAAIEI